MDFEAAWCPVCSRLIEPKRFTVPVAPPQPRTPAPPPTSPQSSPSKKDTTAQKRKPTARARGGLVQGTGRVKPNGTIKRTESTASKSQQGAQPSKPIKYRTIIDQGPLPLYCSEECRRLDDKASSGSVGTESSGSSSIPSESSIATASSAAYEQLPPPHVIDEPQYTSPSVAVLAKLYNFPPAPPPAPICFEDAAEPELCRAPIGDNGLIMAGRYLRELCSEPAKPQTGRHRAPIEPVKTVPGWNDGSNAWRSCLYNLTSPSPTPQIKKKRVVRSQLGDASIPLRNTSASSLPDNAAMINKYAESLTRRSGTISSSSETTVLKRERSLLPPGAEGRLLVPDVKLKVRTGSSASVASKVRSPLSATSDSGDDESTVSKCDSPQSPVHPPQRPNPETRSWSYDNLKTYDMMPFPTKKEKRTQISVVDGKEVRVEVEVEVQQPRKRLFLFPAPVRASS
ncbi:hypothetical protein P691DRAFT_754265 [Macrolepiota fuliginosa MF-IS2]|uniref:Uncharacterized protein n=1 Tax=Macrolepiota fuliginosa MF-IS2 TaxID=1400762 RepID=A0A9P5XPS0_9AGAR|nr:hypothetical protein P691DRAFT_754265 [Macrolepiota fuliginosa MF-IS2]